MNKIHKGLSSNGAFVTSESHSTRQNRAGETAEIPTREGWRVYRYMQAQEAFAAGQAAAMYFHIDNADVDAAVAIGGKTLTGTGDFTAGEFGTTFPSAYVSIDANTGANQTRAIETNVGSANILKLEYNHGFDVALDTTSDYVTYDVNFVCLATASEIVIPRGVAVSAISANEWGWFQISGFCPQVRSIGSTDPIVAGEPIVASSTAGAVRGMTNGGSTVDELAMKFGYAVHASAAGDVAGAGVAAFLTCV